MEYTPDWLPGLMEGESYMEYHAFWDQYKHNHKAHGAYAMAAIGATPDQIKDYFHRNNSTIIKKIEGSRYDSDVTRELDTVNSDDIEDYKGAHAGFYTVLDHFMKEFETTHEGNRNKLIEDVLPKVIDGPLLGTLHGTIQLAYGYLSRSDQAVCDGAALFWNEYSSYFPKNPAKAKDTLYFGKGKNDLLTIFKLIREDKELVQDSHPLYRDALEKRINDYVRLTDSWKFPTWFDPRREDMSQMVRLIDWLVGLCARGFVAFDIPNHFFLLHGITGFWALRTIIHFVDFKTAMVGLRGHLIALFTIYGTSGGVGMTKKVEDYWQGDTVTQETWDDIFKECLSKPRETHCYKVIQSCYQVWKPWPGTPFARDYIASCRIVMDHKYFFPNPMPL